MKRLFILAAAITAALIGMGADTRAQQAEAYPTRPINLIVPYNPGATPDIIARLVGPKLEQALKTTIIVVNRTGAGSNVGTQAVIAAKPDGYTIGIVGNPQTIHHIIAKTPQYNFARDITPLTNAAEGSYALIINPEKLKLHTVGELVAYAKANPGKINYGSGGVATSPHLVGEWFKSLAGIDIVHVPYSGTSTMNNALLAGQIDMAFTSPVYIAEHVKRGALRAIAVTLPQRDTDWFPEAPTMIEAGVKLEYTYWIGFFGPAGMPASIANRLSSEIAKILKSPEIVENLKSSGLLAVGDTPEHFKATIDTETELMTKLLDAANLRASR